MNGVGQQKDRPSQITLSVTLNKGYRAVQKGINWEAGPYGSNYFSSYGLLFPDKSSRLVTIYYVVNNDLELPTILAFTPMCWDGGLAVPHHAIPHI